MHKLYTTKKKLIIFSIIVVCFLVIFIPVYFLVIKSKKTLHNGVTLLHNGVTPTLPIKGYYLMSWQTTTAPQGLWDFGVWFGGETPQAAIENNLQNSNKITVGKKILDLGGGLVTGIWSNVNELDYVISRLSDIKTAGWDGLCFDVEVCTNNIDFRDAFKQCFAACKKQGLMVIVTTSGIKPYACDTGTGQGAELMQSWINDTNIDYISPQLYGTDGTTLVPQDLKLFNNIQNKILTTIPYDSDWVKLNTDNVGINPGGYIIWNVSSSTPKTNYCGNDWTDANKKCSTKCPGAVDSECPTGQKCYSDLSNCTPY